MFRNVWLGVFQGRGTNIRLKHTFKCLVARGPSLANCCFPQECGQGSMTWLQAIFVRNQRARQKQVSPVGRGALQRFRHLCSLRLKLLHGLAFISASGLISKEKAVTQGAPLFFFSRLTYLKTRVRERSFICRLITKWLQ